MTKKKLIIIVILIAIMFITIELIQSFQKKQNPEIDYIIKQNLQLTNDEIQYLRDNKITFSQLRPYLEYETFNLYFFFYYEEIRTQNHITHLEALNRFHHPDYFSLNQNPTTVLFFNSPLVLVNKQFFLPEDYVPNNLMNISEANVSYIKRENEEMVVEQEALIHYEQLYLEAKKIGIELVVFSGYRDWYKQKILYYYTFGENNLISAKPGHSEHQTGLAFDVSTLEYGLTNFFANTFEYQWLKENAHHFGFIIRFPEGKQHLTGYEFEPWHLRYIGPTHAKIIYENNLTLEEYLFKYFEIK